MVALGKVLHDFANFCTLALPEIRDAIGGMASAAVEALPQKEVAPPAEEAPPAAEEQGFLGKLVSSLGGGEGGGLFSQICGTCIQAVQGFLPA